jgi:hypothetical protein
MPRPRLPVPPGSTYGHLTVLHEADPRPRAWGAMERVLLCRCDCGEEREVYLKNLRSGQTVSCGCYGRGRLRRGEMNPAPQTAA